jgi:IS1 family transposase
MNKLSNADRVRVISCLVEGNSIRSTVRMTGIAKNTVTKLLVDIGRACTEYQDKAFRNLTLGPFQCDEIWSYIGCKEKNVPESQKGHGRGDIWTWTAICSKTKLIPCWYVGNRDAAAANHFMHDLKGRVITRIQLTTDALATYRPAVEDAFGYGNIDYAQLVKIYGTPTQGKGADIRYSPAQCMGARKAVLGGHPVYEHISTSHVERQNLSMRMGMRRFTRLTNAFSKKVENHEHAVALYFMYYNFARIHQTLRVTPAMEARISDHVWSLEEIVSLI